MTLKSPFPYFGGKSRIAPDVWLRFGEVNNYVEPFFGSGAMLLANPADEPPTETVNDIDGWLTNFWRALQAEPEAVAHYADWPVSELDLHARGDWLFYRDDAKAFVERVRGDPEYYDAKSAGWWVWGQSCWIGSGWGPKDDAARVSRRIPTLKSSDGIHRKLPGVSRQLPSLSNNGQGVTRQSPRLSGDQGIHRKRPHLAHKGKGVNRQLPELAGRRGGLRDGLNPGLYDYLADLSDRLRRVRICCGDWTRVLGPSVTEKHGMTAVFLDPPYSDKANRETVYASDSHSVAHDVRRWAIANGDNPMLRIALCGYTEEHDAEIPATWERLAWKAVGGYGNQGEGDGRDNAERECIWFSPACLNPETEAQPALLQL